MRGRVGKNAGASLDIQSVMAVPGHGRGEELLRIKVPGVDCSVRPPYVDGISYEPFVYKRHC